MANIELTNYIKEELADGETKASVVSTLKKEGWTALDIEEAYKLAKSGKTIPKPPTKTQEEHQPSEHMTTFLGIGDLISFSINIVKEQLWTYIGILALGWAVIVGFMFLIGIVIAIFVGAGIALGSDAGIALIGSGIVLGIVIFLIFIAVAVWPQLALIKAISNQEKKLGVFEAYSMTKHQILPAFWMGILMMLVMYGGYILFFIPGLIVTVWIFFAMYVLVNEDITGLDALKKSRLLVKGNWWGIFGRFLLMWIIVYAVMLLLFSVLIGALGDTVGQIIYQLVSVAINVLIGPFFVAFFYTMYKNLKSIKEPVDVKQEGSGVYIAFAVIGAAVIIMAIVALSAVLAYMPEAFEDSDNMNYNIESTFTEEFPLLEEGDPLLKEIEVDVLPIEDEQDAFESFPGMEETDPETQDSMRQLENPPAEQESPQE